MPTSVTSQRLLTTVVGRYHKCSPPPHAELKQFFQCSPPCECGIKTILPMTSFSLKSGTNAKFFFEQRRKSRSRNLGVSYLRVFSLAHTLYDTLYYTSVKICRSNTRQLALTLETLQRTAHSNALAYHSLVLDFEVDIGSALNYFLERPLRVPTCCCLSLLSLRLCEA